MDNTLTEEHRGLGFDPGAWQIHAPNGSPLSQSRILSGRLRILRDIDKWSSLRLSLQ